MGRGYLRWALNNRALFRAIYHPDVSRQASSRLRTAVEKFADSVQREIKATWLDGRHVNVPYPIDAVHKRSAYWGRDVDS